MKIITSWAAWLFSYYCFTKILSPIHKPFRTVLNFHFLVAALMLMENLEGSLLIQPGSSMLIRERVCVCVRARAYALYLEELWASRWWSRCLPVAPRYELEVLALSLPFPRFAAAAPSFRSGLFVWAPPACLQPAERKEKEKEKKAAKANNHETLWNTQIWALNCCFLKENANWPHLDLVSEILNLVHSSIVLVSQLSQLFLSSLVHLLQVRTFIFCVTQTPLTTHSEIMWVKQVILYLHMQTWSHSDAPV